MKTLYLMRHAEAETAGPADSDHGRLLTDHGRTQAAKARAFIEGCAFPPDHVIASDSFRTKETAKIIKKGEIVFDRALYLSPAAKLLNAIQDTEQRHNSLLVVAHNPGIAELAAHLAGDHPDLEDFSPATVAVFTIETDDWYELEPETAVLQKVFRS